MAERKELSRDQQVFLWRLVDAARLESVAQAAWHFELLKEAITKVVADYELVPRCDAKEPRYILMRGNERYRGVNHLGDLGINQSGGEELVIRHRKAMEYRILTTEELEKSRMLVEESCMEVFKLDRRCTGCGATTYQSKNYMQLPEWVGIQEFRAKHGEHVLMELDIR